MICACVSHDVLLCIQPPVAAPDIGQLQFQNAESMFQSQLQELQSMGFPDRRRNLQGVFCNYKSNTVQVQHSVNF